MYRGRDTPHPSLVQDGAPSVKKLLQRDSAVGSPGRVGSDLAGHVDAEAAMSGFADSLRNGSCFVAGVHVLIIHRCFRAIDDVKGIASFEPVARSRWSNWEFCALGGPDDESPPRACSEQANPFAG